ncbi:hypothetical protein A4X13_0g8174 [Tilletia indica]|uniref:Uncharacterized protein n=1 Tax=Tilletia indica TaxID=43049 RepID=A0A177TAT6_9BASI|nr:hypothetical protein A4X13_0g8174 [Tilletia indica]
MGIRRVQGIANRRRIGRVRGLDRRCGRRSMVVMRDISPSSTRNLGAHGRRISGIITEEAGESIEESEKGQNLGEV